MRNVQCQSYYANVISCPLFSLEVWEWKLTQLLSWYVMQTISSNSYRKPDSNTPHLYSQWLNSVIYWLIDHCTDRTRTGVTSFDRQFEFSWRHLSHRHCYVDYRRCNVAFTTAWRSKCTLKYAFQSKQELREILTVCSRWRKRYRLEGFVHILNLFVC